MQLQARLFPAVATTPKMSSNAGGFFTNMVFKPEPPDSETPEDLAVKKESKELFAIVRENSATVQPARWPSECQVLNNHINHISYVPQKPEPFYVPTGKEVQPKPCGEESGIIVYQYYPISAVNYFNRSSVGGSSFLLPTLPAPEEESLIFESRFESGNLAKAIKITAVFYELYLRTDMYTNKHMQWFYFRITNMKRNMNYRFSIVNLTKDGSLFNEGMKPLLYSTRNARLYNKGWMRCGDNITYYCNDNVLGPDDPDQLLTYTLSFTLEFPYDKDEVYLAYNFPYTYTDLQDYLLTITRHPIKSTFTTLRLLCKTLAGNNVYYVTITAPDNSSDNKKKKAIILTARVHPGETPSSWMMKGVLDFLTSDSGPAKELREKFVFKIIPMLNPDGVIVGNTRCSLTGKDLNRQYRTVIRETYPSIWYTKLIIRRMLEGCGVAMYCDFHAHSRRHNIFLYGCENRRGAETPLLEQIFPLMMHKNAPEKFSFEDCRFKVQRAKEGTGRVVMWLTGITHSYTLEASFAGSKTGNRSETHFSPQDYEHMGKTFCQTLLDFFDDTPRQERLRNKIVERLISKGSSADEPLNISLSDYSSDDGDSSSSSYNEGCNDYQLLLVPPPSPIRKKCLTKTKKSRKNAIKKQPPDPRKPFTVFKASLNFPKPSTSASDSYSDSDFDYKKRPKTGARKKRTKLSVKQRSKIVTKYSDSEIQKSVSSPPESLSFDLLPCGKFRSKSWNRDNSKGLDPVLKSSASAKHEKATTQQLVEVQAKLISIKKRLWFAGSPEGPQQIPLTFGSKFLRNCYVRTQYRQSRVKEIFDKGYSGKSKEIEGKEKRLKRQFATENPNAKCVRKVKTSLEISLKIETAEITTKTRNRKQRKAKT